MPETYIHAFQNKSANPSNKQLHNFIVAYNKRGAYVIGIPKKLRFAY